MELFSYLGLFDFSSVGSVYCSSGKGSKCFSAMRTYRQQNGNYEAQQKQGRGELLHSDKQNGSEENVVEYYAS